MKFDKIFRNFRTRLTHTQAKANKAQTPTLPDTADVVIIGGGSVGCNTLYQLAKRGVQAILLEQSQLASGTTWHTRGLLWTLRLNDVEIQLLRSTRELLLSLKEETKLDSGWNNNGGLYVARTQERLEEFKRLATIGQAFKIDARVVTPDEAYAHFPLLNPKVIVGGLYNPMDGCIDPTNFVNALSHAAKNKGAQIFEDCPVTGIITSRTQFGNRIIEGVRTPFGEIKTNCVVNCAGVWGRKTAKLAGLKIPSVPIKHAYIVTESVPKARGLPNVRHQDGLIYFKVQGDSLMMGGYEPNPTIFEDIPDKFAFQQLDFDWTQFPHLATAVELVPEIEKVGVRETVCVPECFTPDHKPLVGEDPRLRGFFYGCAFNSLGMMLAGGCGEQLALWILNGRPDLHMYSFDVRRFTKEQLESYSWAKERSHESYATTYDIVFPQKQFLAGRNFQKDPFHQELLASNCVFEETQGWERPGWFAKTGPNPVPPYDWGGSYGHIPNVHSPYTKLLRQDYHFNFPVHLDIIGSECLACRNEVVLFNRSYLGKFYLSGPDAQAAANWLFTADTQKHLGEIVYTCMLNGKGNVEADVWVTPLVTGTSGIIDPILKGRGFYVLACGAVSAHTQAHINQVINQKGFRVTVDDVTTSVGVLSVQGPKSRAFLQELLDIELSDEAFPAMTAQLAKIKDSICRVMRMGLVGELGYELQVPWDLCPHVYKTVWKKGKDYNLKHAGYRALYSLSAEKGLHLWSSDIRNEDNPLEAGLESTCRLEGDFLGKEALGKVKFNGLRKKIAYFYLEEKVPVWGLETIWRNNEVVGFLRRGDFGFTLNKSIGIGYISSPNGEEVSEEYLKSGKYEIEVMGTKYPAAMYLKSPFDPDNKRVLGIYDE